MNLIRELWDKNLPNFGYVIEMDNGDQYVVVLGGQSIPKGDIRCSCDAIIRRNKQMQQIYRRDTLSDDDKKELARLMRKMYAVCEYREEGRYTREEQSAFIDKLSENEKMQLEEQIQMLKDCRCFYQEYIFNG